MIVVWDGGSPFFNWPSNGYLKFSRRLRPLDLCNDEAPFVVGCSDHHHYIWLIVIYGLRHIQSFSSMVKGSVRVVTPAHFDLVACLAIANYAEIVGPYSRTVNSISHPNGTTQFQNHFNHPRESPP